MNLLSKKKISSPQLSSEQNFKKEKLIDSGALEGFYKISVNEDSQIYAVKQIDLQNFSEKNRVSILTEAQNDYKLMHKSIPNVLRSFGSYYNLDKQVYKFSVEYSETSLAQVVKTKGTFLLDDFVPIFQDLLKGNLINLTEKKLQIY